MTGGVNTTGGSEPYVSSVAAKSAGDSGKGDALPPTSAAAPAATLKPAASLEKVTTETIVRASLLGIAFVALFYRFFYIQHLHSSDKIEDWGHAYIIPLISLYLVRQKWSEIVAQPRWVFWPALAPMLLGIACYVFFVVGYPNHMFAGFSVFATLGAMLLLLFGPAVFRFLFLPVAFLCFGVTISEQVMIKATFPLKLIASQGAWVILKLVSPIFGYFVDVNGNLIEIVTKKGTIIPLNVAEACSGMRMVIAFIALGAAVALISCKLWWQRAALLLLAVPVAVFMNIIRVAVLGLLSLWNTNAAAGQAHMFIGTILLIPGLFLFMGVVWALERAVETPSNAKHASPKKGGST